MLREEPKGNKTPPVLRQMIFRGTDGSLWDPLCFPCLIWEARRRGSPSQAFSGREESLQAYLLPDTGCIR